MRNNPLPTQSCRKFFSTLAVLIAVLAPVCASAKPAPTQPIAIASWQLQYAAKAPQTGAEIAAPGFSTTGWYPATVPGTVLTTLVNNRVYPEPLYGENNRPEIIPESLARQSYWYRAQFEIPKSYTSQRVWLNFEGINYSATVWVNGRRWAPCAEPSSAASSTSPLTSTPGKMAAVAVLVAPQPHPGDPHEHTIPTAWARTAASPPLMARPFCPP